MVGVGLGLALLVVGVLARVYDREERLADILDLPYGEQDVDLEAVTQQSSIVENISGLAGKMVTQLDERGSLITLLEKARVPMRPGRVRRHLRRRSGSSPVPCCGTLTGQLVVAVAALVVTPFAARAFLNFRISRRKKKFEEQFPDAPRPDRVVAVSAGHTFLRSIQMMCEESPPPLSEEFARVVNETQLGDPLVDALERMGQRLQIRDVDWVVQAIRIQQQVGGKLADLLHTLADFIRAREEVRREVTCSPPRAASPPTCSAASRCSCSSPSRRCNPGYMDPMFEGWGPVVLLASCAWAAARVRPDPPHGQDRRLREPCGPLTIFAVGLAAVGIVALVAGVQARSAAPAVDDPGDYLRSLDGRRGRAATSSPCSSRSRSSAGSFDRSGRRALGGFSVAPARPTTATTCTASSSTPACRASTGPRSSSPPSSCSGSSASSAASACSCGPVGRARPAPALHRWPHRPPAPCSRRCGSTGSWRSASRRSCATCPTPST